LASRDWGSFAEYVSARSVALRRAAYLMVGDVGLAEDLVQEALVKTYVALPRLRDPASIEAYTRKAISTTAISWFRRRGWSERPADTGAPDAVAPSPADDLDTRIDMWQHLLRLPVRQRVAIVLRYYEDLSEAATAEAMNCAVGTVKSQVAAGLAKLRAWVGEQRLPELNPAEIKRAEIKRAEIKRAEITGVTSE
jgi:RNA polymerase sigma-70 factor (sigma-E family)